MADAPVAIAGYSGGGLATGWAAALQPSYAPELKIDAAVGGGVPAGQGKNARGRGLAPPPPPPPLVRGRPPRGPPGFGPLGLVLRPPLRSPAPSLQNETGPEPLRWANREALRRVGGPETVRGPPQSKRPAPGPLPTTPRFRDRKHSAPADLGRRAHLCIAGAGQDLTSFFSTSGSWCLAPPLNPTCASLRIRSIICG
ncbi:lipase family protein [Nocardia carnea]|uniref:lipase family protein n=1 Tax=Nocardia carnea TaxID=37328 RepID=UPI003D774096